MILSLESPSLKRDTKTSCLPSTSKGVGSVSSQYSTPSKFFKTLIASSTSIEFSNNAEQKVPCPVLTPTLAFEGSTIKFSIFNKKVSS